MKKYIAKTNVSINIVLPNGANRHIAFSALTGGGSVFYTDDPEIIQAMERHYKFGKLFRVDTRYVPEKQRNKPTPKPEAAHEQPAVSVANDTPTPPSVEAADAPVVVEENLNEPESEPQTAEEEEVADAEADQEDDEAEDDGLKTIVVSDPDSAKSYLAEHFGYSRTKIKTLKAIKEAAAANGIVFEGI